MSKSCAYVLRVCIVIFTAAALALAIVACFVPLYGTGPSTDMAVAQSRNTVCAAVAAADSNSTTGLNAYAVNSSNNICRVLYPDLDVNGFLTVFDSQSMDLFNYKATVSAANSSSTTGVSTHVETWTLRTRYFTCAQGRTMIQAAEGVAVVACVLCCANFILSLFLFCFQPVVRVPLCVYAFLAAAAEGAALGLLLHLYLNGWCDEMDVMKDTGFWEIKTGLILMIVSCALSVITCILALVLSI